MRVMPNPGRAVDGRLVVLHPRTGKPFPPEPTTLSAADARDPAVRRLLPPPEDGGLPGGVYGDLVIVADAPAPKTSKPKE